MTNPRTGSRALPQLLSAFVRPVGRLFSRLWLRWSVFSAATVLGWIVLAAWMAGLDPRVSPADTAAVWWMLGLCGLVGSGQWLAAAPFRDDDALRPPPQTGSQPRTAPRQRSAMARRDGVRRREYGRRGVRGDWLLRWWQWLLLFAVHGAVVVALAGALVGGDQDAMLEVVFDVLLLGGLGWAVVPLVLLTVLIVLGLVLGLIVLGVRGVAEGSRAPAGAALTRARAISGGVAMLGAAIALTCVIAAIPFMGLHYAGKGSGLAVIVLLLLEAVRVVPGPPGWLHELDRDGYLLGIVAIVQYLTFRLWGPRIWRDATPGAAADDLLRADDLPHADGLPPAQT